MKDNEKFTYLEKEIRSLPEPDYDKKFDENTQDEMHSNLINFANSYEKKNKRRKVIKRLASVAVAFALVFGISFGSPAIASTFKAIPIIGSVFEIIGDKGLQDAEKSGFSKETKETISVGNSSLRITDIIYDGNRISLGFIITNYNDENPFYEASFEVDKDKFYSGGASSQGEYISNTDYAGVYNLITPEELRKDEFNLIINLKEFNGKKGEWNLNIPVPKIKGESFLVTKQSSSEDYRISMNRVTFTPATTNVNFDLTEPINSEELNQIIRFRLYDDKGNQLEELSAGGGGCDDCKTVDGKITLDASVQYEPLTEIPDYLILEPYINSSKESIEELRIKIPLDKNG